MSSDAAGAQRRIWTIGDYPAVARRLQPVSDEVVERAAIRAGQQVLDVGVGTGNTAIAAARLGAAVTGVDLTPAQLDRARERCAAEGVDVALREADAQALPFADGTFDVVVSVFGVIFAPDHAAAAAELARVCRDGGTVAVTAWTGGGWSARFAQRIQPLLPPPAPGSPRPDEWGDAATAVPRLAAAGIDATAEERDFHWEFPSVAEAVDFLLTKAGPFIAMFEGLAAAGRDEEARAALAEVFSDANVTTDGTCRVPATWLLVMGRRQTEGP